MSARYYSLETTSPSYPLEIHTKFLGLTFKKMWIMGKVWKWNHKSGIWFSVFHLFLILNNYEFYIAVIVQSNFALVVLWGNVGEKKPQSSCHWDQKNPFHLRSSNQLIWLRSTHPRCKQIITKCNCRTRGGVAAHLFLWTLLKQTRNCCGTAIMSRRQRAEDRLFSLCFSSADQLIS